MKNPCISIVNSQTYDKVDLRIFRGSRRMINKTALIKHPLIKKILQKIKKEKSIVENKPFTFKYSKPDVKKIVIAGADPDLARTIQMCLSAYLIPIGIHFLPEDPHIHTEMVVDPNNLYGQAKNDKKYIEELPKKIPVLDEKEFCQAADNQDIEILCGSYGLRERDNFMRILIHCKNKLKIKQTVRHPAYLLDRLSFDCNAYICSGFPGSGNMLVQNILDQVTIHERNSNWHNQINDAARTYAFYYWSSLLNYMESQLYESGFWRSQTSPTTNLKYGAAYFDLDGSDRPSLISGLPIKGHFWANPWAGSHEPPSKAALNFYERYGTKFIFISRNPLDTIVSFAGKTTSLAKNRAAGWLIDNRKWFEDTLQTVVYYYQQAKESKDRIIIAKYEDFLSSPEDSMVNFAKEVNNINLDRTSATSIWNTLSGTTLSADPGHYWRPGEGKWAQYIPIEYRPLIEKSGILDLAKEFGYKIDLNHLTRKQGNQDSATIPDNTILALEENRWFTCTGKAQSFSSPDISILHEKNLMAATYKKYEKTFQDLFNSQIFCWLLDATGEITEENFLSAQKSEKTEAIAV